MDMINELPLEDLYIMYELFEVATVGNNGRITELVNEGENDGNR